MSHQRPDHYRNLWNSGVETLSPDGETRVGFPAYEFALRAEDHKTILTRRDSFSNESQFEAWGPAPRADRYLNPLFAHGRVFLLAEREGEYTMYSARINDPSPQWIKAAEPLNQGVDLMFLDENGDLSLYGADPVTQTPYHLAGQFTGGGSHVVWGAPDYLSPSDGAEEQARVRRSGALRVNGEFDIQSEGRFLAISIQSNGSRDFQYRVSEGENAVYGAWSRPMTDGSVQLNHHGRFLQYRFTESRPGAWKITPPKLEVTYTHDHDKNPEQNARYASSSGGVTTGAADNGGLGGSLGGLNGSLAGGLEGSLGGSLGGRVNGNLGGLSSMDDLNKDTLSLDSAPSEDQTNSNEDNSSAASPQSSRQKKSESSDPQKSDSPNNNQPASASNTQSPSNHDASPKSPKPAQPDVKSAPAQSGDASPKQGQPASRPDSKADRDASPRLNGDSPNPSASDADQPDPRHDAPQSDVNTPPEAKPSPRANPSSKPNTPDNGAEPSQSGASVSAPNPQKSSSGASPSTGAADQKASNSTPAPSSPEVKSGPHSPSGKRAEGASPAREPGEAVHHEPMPLFFAMSPGSAPLASLMEDPPRPSAKNVSKNSDGESGGALPRPRELDPAPDDTPAGNNPESSPREADDSNGGGASPSPQSDSESPPVGGAKPHQSSLDQYGDIPARFGSGAGGRAGSSASTLDRGRAASDVIESTTSYYLASADPKHNESRPKGKTPWWLLCLLPWVRRNGKNSSSEETVEFEMDEPSFSPRSLIDEAGGGGAWNRVLVFSPEVAALHEWKGEAYVLFRNGEIWIGPALKNEADWIASSANAEQALHGFHRLGRIGADVDFIAMTMEASGLYTFGRDRNGRPAGWFAPGAKMNAMRKLTLPKDLGALRCAWASAGRLCLMGESNGHRVVVSARAAANGPAAWEKEKPSRFQAGETVCVSSGADLFYAGAPETEQGLLWLYAAERDGHHGDAWKPMAKTPYQGGDVFMVGDVKKCFLIEMERGRPRMWFHVLGRGEDGRFLGRFTREVELPRNGEFYGSSVSGGELVLEGRDPESGRLLQMRAPVRGLLGVSAG
ncbi:MAG: hypothetical protein GC154_11500 [bacterium]|nr:hypothetical protein [bacterium]